MVIRRVGPLSVAKIAGVLYALMGLFIGGIFSLISAVMGSALSQQNPQMPAFAGVLFGVGAIVALPIFYGVLGFVMTLIMAALYNLVAGWVGGIEIDVS
jgi:hypothetical protein